jgi:hypothetical protein
MVPAMNGYIIIYRLSKGTPNNVYTRFQKKFFGQETSSHGGKYRYHRKGLLDDIPHRKLIRGVILIGPDDVDDIVDFLQRYGAEIHIRQIEFTDEDRRSLGVDHE